MARTRDFLSRVRARMGPQGYRDATAEERRKSGRRIRVGPKQRPLASRRPSSHPVLRTFAAVGLLYATILWFATLCSTLDALTDQRYEWLADAAAFLLATALSPYGLIPLLIPVLFFVTLFIALRSSFEKTTPPEISDKIRHTKLATKGTATTGATSPTPPKADEPSDTA
ncbi:MAG: hypothetical protein HN742_07070 [Lentisphaerae bacterium]|nr:hypothetical protein [Lentisphaerota bacterium]MBT4814657.1 hypothetical protein [Lentisphaerota bacterium]MBT5608644.1 hypothetical protein [Lentisphaerota bacterium]MBT7841614.1 hypothetical protein [Lentisphaerota bacterium]